MKKKMISGEFIKKVISTHVKLEEESFEYLNTPHSYYDAEKKEIVMDGLSKTIGRPKKNK